MASHELFMTSYPYMYDITPSVFMTSYPIYMVSPILLSWQHNNYTCHLTHYIWHHRDCIYVITPAVSMTSHQVWKSSHLAYIWYHDHSTWHHIHTLWHESSSFMTSQPLHSWHEIFYIWCHFYGPWHLIPYKCDIIATLSETSHPLCLWIHIHYIWHETYCVQTGQQIYLSSHPRYLYLCDHTHSTCLQYVWHHMNCRWHPIHSEWYQTTLWHHTHCIHVITPSISDITSTVAAS